MKKKSVSTLRDVQAGFWKRLIAYIIDVVVMMIVVVIPIVIVRRSFSDDYYLLEKNIEKGATGGAQTGAT